MRLLALSKDTDSIICPTTGTRAGSVTLSGSVYVGTIARLFMFYIPWISSNDTDRMLCILFYGHCCRNASAPRLVLIGELP